MTRVVRLLHLRRIRRQPLRTVLVLVAVASGVSLAVSVLVMRAGLESSFARVGRRLAGPAPLRIVGPLSRAGLDERVVGVVARVEGVAVAAPAVQAVTIVERPGGARTFVLAIGADCGVVRLPGAPGCAPGSVAPARDSDPPVTSAALVRRMGRAAFVRTDAGRIPLAAAPTLAGLDALDGGRVVAFPLTQAQRVLSRTGRVDVVYVVPRPRVALGALRARLQRAVGPWNGVLDATEPPPGSDYVATTFLPIFSVLALFGLGIGGLLIANIVTLALEERRRDLAVGQAVGATPALVVVGTLAEFGTLGLAGGLLGALGAWTLAHPLLASASTFTEKVSGVGLAVSMPFSLVVVSAAIGVSVALVAAWLPARRAARLDIAGELSARGMRAEAAPATSLRRAVVFGAVGAAGVAATWIAGRGAGLQPWQPALGETGVLVSSIAILLSVGALAPVVLRALGPATGRVAAGLRLAVSNLVREPRRTSVMTVAVASAVGTAFMIASAVTAIRHEITSSFARTGDDWVLVSALPANNSFDVDAALGPATVAALARVPGVAAVERSAFLLVGHRTGGQIGVSADDHPAFVFHRVAGPPPERVARGGRVLVGTALARRRGLRPGSPLRLETPTGYATVTVGGIWQDPDTNGNAVTMPMALLTRLYGPQPANGIRLRAAPGISGKALAARVGPVAAGLDPGLRVRTPTQQGREIAHDVASFVAPFWTLQQGLLLVALVAVLSTLLLVGVQRRRELGLLGAVGMTPGELARMTLAEAGTIGVLGAVLGTLAGVPMLVAYFDTAPLVFGAHDPVRADVGAPALYGLIALAVVLVGAALPAWRALRMPVAEALQYE